jgi:hypothetical protein
MRERIPPGPSNRARNGDEMDEENGKIAHQRIVAGRVIPRKYVRIDNSPATGKWECRVAYVTTKAGAVGEELSKSSPWTPRGRRGWLVDKERSAAHRLSIFALLSRHTRFESRPGVRLLILDCRTKCPIQQFPPGAGGPESPESL